MSFLNWRIPTPPDRCQGGISRAAIGHGGVQAFHVVGRQWRATVIDDKGRLEERKPLDRQPGRGGVEGQNRAGRPAEHGGRGTRHVDERVVAPTEILTQPAPNN